MADAGLRYAATDESLTIWWDRPGDARPGHRYQVTVSGGAAHETHETTVTHYTIDDLQPSHTYRIAVSLDADGDGHACRELGTITARTTAVKRMLDVTKPPYCAVGNGRTLNTTVIQRALDDCDADSAVLIPAGTFLTGALRMHSHTELVVAAGATLQGTTNPADYEPYIRSRFEGIEMDCLSSLINIGELDHNGPANCTACRTPTMARIPVRCRCSSICCSTMCASSTGSRPAATGAANIRLLHARGISFAADTI
ncbi:MULTISPECIES: fibronectin type III domain-containing protein [Bifidobacterium]|uniref:fibronectin type III domain-containing protein n=1 Tax=Bifidobacterium TaxID=1678 RepID=UPI001BDC8EA1|nr:MULTISPECIES: fibronectin type III domain-containing protein [Bifidobacterium]MBT1161095.1 hypothetical protein [Bifidobacterium sp. SO1]MBW3078169.1 hypothetical protein [Bifidobacterium simiiventris]